MQKRYKIATLAICAASLAIQSGQVLAGGLGNCYVRGDVGYGWSASDRATASITPDTPQPPANFVFAGVFTTATGGVQNADLDNSWFGEVGLGCAFVRQTMRGGSIKDAPQTISSPTGLRGDITFGFHGNRDFNGIPVNPPALPLVPVPPPVPPVVTPPTPPPVTPPIDPVHARLQANTLMFNLYYDLPTIHVFTPYVGAGLGVAFLDLSGVTFTNGRVARLDDNRETNLAWSLMAGVATNVGRGIMLDLGYRYLNMGDISAGNSVPGFSLKLNDVSEHQIKAGVRVPLSLFGG